ncbi:MAG: hypothetical protein N3G22_03075 [Candidatus Micrarchaeota archaeon]|nr:hypothetical protein [Candidatus Micrarchaeota archaeon]
MISSEEIVREAKSKEVVLTFAFALAVCLFIFIFPKFGVPAYFLSVLAIVIVISIWKKNSVRIAGLLAVILLSLFSIAFNGVKFGIDFSGGVRIPVLLEKPVDSLTMDEMVATIKTRAAAFGLAEVKVRPIGDSEIYVELPQSSPELVKDVETVLLQQGVYSGIVDGKLAISGSDIYTGSITRVPSQYLHGADWGVSFSVTQAGATKFANVVKGKANYPLYMFLDRPSDAIVVISEKTLTASAKKAGAVPISKAKAHDLARSALRLEGDDIEVYIEEELAKNFTLSPKTNRTRAIVQAGSPLAAKLREAGFVVAEKSEEDMTPSFSISAAMPASDAINEWKAVGLLSAPRLVPSVTEGVPNFAYTINGPASGSTPAERAKDALRKEKEVESILKGGALPVQISIGSKTVVPAPLGAEFLRLSLIGILFSLVAISLMVSLRYRNLKIVLPMIFISLAELTILMAIIGAFTIDLAAMAGILAAIGVGIDAQIVVTDELLKKEEETRKRMEKAFGIITTSVTVAVVAMLPLLLFSGLVEVIGFATATILGALLGLFISRPAYGAIAERLFG